jgi:5-methylcytosine-specific restriction protein A
MMDRRYLTQSQREDIVKDQDEKCAECGTPLISGHYEFDHIQALEHDGDNARDNWRAICTSPCHKAKTRKDHQARAKRDRIAVGGRQRKGPPMAGTRASGIRRRMDGTVERR